MAAYGFTWMDFKSSRMGHQVTTGSISISIVPEGRRNSPNGLLRRQRGLGRPMLSLPGNMQLFGAVALSREQNPGLAVGISRERLVQNDTYEQLKQFVRGGIDWMTVCYAREQARAHKTEQADQDEKQTAAQAVRSALAIIDQEATVPDATKRMIRSLLNEAVTLSAQEAEAHISELAMLRVLASAGTTVMVLDHTLRNLTAQLDDIVDRLESSLADVPANGVNGLDQALADLRSWSSTATGQGQLVGLLVGPEARTQRKSHAPSSLRRNVGTRVCRLHAPLRHYARERRACWPANASAARGGSICRPSQPLDQFLQGSEEPQRAPGTGGGGNNTRTVHADGIRHRGWGSARES